MFAYLNGVVFDGYVGSNGFVNMGGQTYPHKFTNLLLFNAEDQPIFNKILLLC